MNSVHFLGKLSNRARLTKVIISGCVVIASVACSPKKKPTSTSTPSPVSRTQGAAPYILSVSSSSGSTLGGETLTIYGLYFQTGIRVELGDVECTNPMVFTGYLTCTTGAHAPGIVDLVVTNPDMQTARMYNVYTYVTPSDDEGPTPAIYYVSPNSGSIHGGSLIRIRGDDFQSGATVRIGSVPCTSVSFISARELHCNAGRTTSSGLFDVTVTNPGGRSVTHWNAFTYLRQSNTRNMTLNVVEPNMGPTTGGTLIIIHGAGFVNGETSITVGGISCAASYFLSSTELVCETPVSSPGYRDIEVTNNGQYATLRNAFYFNQSSGPSRNDHGGTSEPAEPHSSIPQSDSDSDSDSENTTDEPRRTFVPREVPSQPERTTRPAEPTPAPQWPTEPTPTRAPQRPTEPTPAQAPQRPTGPTQAPRSIQIDPANPGQGIQLPAQRPTQAFESRYAGSEAEVYRRYFNERLRGNYASRVELPSGTVDASTYSYDGDEAFTPGYVIHDPALARRLSTSRLNRTINPGDVLSETDVRASGLEEAVVDALSESYNGNLMQAEYNRLAFPSPRTGEQPLSEAAQAYLEFIRETLLARIEALNGSSYANLNVTWRERGRSRSTPYFRNRSVPEGSGEGINVVNGQRDLFVSMLNAVEHNREMDFLVSMVNLATSFGPSILGARNEFMSTYTYLFVAKRFANPMARQYFLHFTLRCGGIY